MQAVLSIPSVTGVDLKLRIAGPGARSYAFIIDWHIRLLAAIAWFSLGTFLVFGTLAIGDGANQGNFALGVVLPAVAIYFLYHPVVELLMAGRTPGKRIARVRVVKTDGAIPGIGAILIRNIFRLIDNLPIAYCVGLVCTILTERSVRIGDLAAGTVLVYDDPEQDALEQFSGTALGRIGMEQLELVRDLLGRWDHLNPATRGDLAQRLLKSLGEPQPSATDLDLHAALESVLSRDEPH